MATDFRLKHAVPMLVVANLDYAADFYINVLRFTLLDVTDGECCLMGRDDRLIYLRLAKERCAITDIQIYLEVAGVRAFWDHVKQFKGLHAMLHLFTRKLGQPEFHIISPEGCFHFVSEANLRAHE